LIGAWIREPLVLDNARLAHQLLIQHSRIEALVSLSRIRSSDDISFRGSVFSADVNLRGARVDGGLDLTSAQFASMLDLRRLDLAADFMLNDARCKNVWLTGAKLGGTIEMLGIRCEEMLDMEGLNAHADLFMGQRSTGQRSSYRSVSLTGAIIGGQLSGSGAHCSEGFDMQGIEVRGDVILRADCRFNTLDATGAVIHGQLDLDNITCTGDVYLQGLHIGTDLLIAGGATLAALDLQGTKVDGRIDLDDINCTGEVSMQRVQVGTDLSISGTASLASLNLSGAKVSGDILMSGCKCDGFITMVGLEVDGRLRLDRISAGKKMLLNLSKCHGEVNLVNATTAAIEMRGAVIGGLLNLSGTVMAGDLDMERLQVGSNLFLRDGATFQQVYLWDATVHGIIEARKAEFSGLLDMNGVRAGYILVQPGAVFKSGVKALYAKVEQNVDLSGGLFHGTVDFAGSEIKGALILSSQASGEAIWSEDSELTLQDASANTVVSAMHLGPNGLRSWPHRLHLRGFIYQRISDSTVEEPAGRRSNTTAEWLVQWVARDSGLSRQPYGQLSNVLFDQGELSKSNTVLYAGRERERRHTRGVRRVGEELLKWTIGYGIGYRYFRSLLWVLVLSAVGALVFAPVVRQHWLGRGASLLFSLDQLLPVVSVAPGADDIAKMLTGWRHIYLACHRILGFLLGSFVVAGLSGITKK
jgi:hypothetical protein